MPPHLAGRKPEIAEFERLLKQTTILENMVLTGLRGVGKTVLLETLKPLAMRQGWLWVGADLSEMVSVSDQNMALRLLTDLSVVTSSMVLDVQEELRLGFDSEPSRKETRLNFETLLQIYERTPGLVADKLKAVLGEVWSGLTKEKGTRGLIFAYDEAQNLSDHSEKDQYPLSLLLDTFQSIQRRDIPFMLVLTGLPTLFPKLVEARTFAERMFRVVFLDRLNKTDSRDAILTPLGETKNPISFTPTSVETIVRISGGYPYFIQFVCREVYDASAQKFREGREEWHVPTDEIIRKLDSDFFAGRWARATDRQRDLLTVVAQLESSDEEFTVHEIVELSKEKLSKSFSSSHVSQMLGSLSEAGLIYKNRHGKYSFAVPLLDQYILRQLENG